MGVIKIKLLWICANCTIFALAKGKMQEWLNWPAWKASKPQKGFGGSNPPLSAKRSEFRFSFFCVKRGIRQSVAVWQSYLRSVASEYCCAMLRVVPIGKSKYIPFIPISTTLTTL